jgi:hypothetical protein
MASAADADDLTVVTPEGDLSEFPMDVCFLEAEGRSTTVIRSLGRRRL